jgi:hypothetical protein
MNLYYIFKVSISFHSLSSRWTQAQGFKVWTEGSRDGAIHGLTATYEATHAAGRQEPLRGPSPSFPFL